MRRVLAFAVLLLAVGAVTARMVVLAADPARLARVAHAGGGVDGRVYTNSLDALEANADKYELFEIDFNFTADGHLVCIHDWGPTAEHNFGRRFDAPPTLAEFERLNAAKSLPKNCTLATLAAWLTRHPGKRIVTDVKDDNVRALAALATAYPTLVDRFIPQIYQPEEYPAVRALGFSRIIFTMYRYFGTYDRLVDFARANPLHAVTMPPAHVPHLVARLREIGIATYVHTINKAEEFLALQAAGVAEIYTDWLRPSR